MNELEDFMKEQEDDLLEQSIGLIPEIRNKLFDIDKPVFTIVSALQLLSALTYIQAGMTEERFMEMSKWLWRGSNELFEHLEKKSRGDKQRKTTE